MNACIQCRDRPAKWQEEKNTKRMYCGFACQNTWYSLVGLKDGENNIDNPNIVGLQANDGLTRLRVTLEQAQEMITIRDQFLPEYGLDTYIPLQNEDIDGPTLFRVNEFIQYGRIQTNMLTNKEFKQVLVAANWLNFSRLVYHLLPEWANTRKFFGCKPLKDLILDALYFYQGPFTEENADLKPFEKQREFFSDFKEKYESDAFDDNQMNRKNVLWSRFDTPKEYWQLHMAFYNNRLAAASELLKRVDLSYENYHVANMYFAACRNGNLDALKILLDSPFQIYTTVDNEEDCHSETDIFLATLEWGHLDIIRYILQDKRFTLLPCHKRLVFGAASMVLNDTSKSEVLKFVLDLPWIEIDSDVVYDILQTNDVASVRVLLNNRRVTNTLIYPDQFQELIDINEDHPDVVQALQAFLDKTKKQRIENKIV